MTEDQIKNAKRIIEQQIRQWSLSETVPDYVQKEIDALCKAALINAKGATHA